MKPTEITYDVSRCYLQDRQGSLPADVYSLLHGWIRGRQYQKLASCFDLSTHDVTGVEGARTLLQIESFFKKNASFAEPSVTRLAALISFEEGEQICQETNDSLDNFYDDLVRVSPSRGASPDIVSKVAKMRRWIDRTLGPFPDFLEQMPKLIEVSAGATATRARRRAIPFLKVSGRVTCTPGAFPYLAALSDYWSHGPLAGKLISRNRVAFVPKSWKTDRTIACEAEGNMCLQLAFDKYAKHRLRRKGINLSDQTRNQELAKEGSISDTLATIDLSMASDTLAYNTVALLLPREWFQYLRSIRSQYYALYPGQKEAYAKFSSMGNGATFALETLVFAAACAAMGPDVYSVYGDDLIIDSDKADGLIELLAFLGFLPNTRKSYIDGPFRESCGKSWYRGFDITPRYVRLLDRRKATWCHLVNILMELSTPYGQLEEYAHGLVKAHKLPLVPYSEDSMSGVFISVTHAYDKKLIRTATKGKHAWMPRTLAYKAKARDRSNRDARSYFLWHLGVHGKKGKRLPYESSRYTISSHKYVRKWVHWKPVVGAPDHLYWWSDNLLQRLG